MSYRENFEEQLINDNRFSRPGTPRAETFGVVWHWTGAAGQARDRAGRYFEMLAKQDPNDGKLDTYASTHLIVDRTGITRTMDLTELAFHCGGEYAKMVRSLFPWWSTTNEDKYHTPNMVTIGVELCVEADGKFHHDTVERATELGTWLTRVFGIHAAHHYRHYDITGKLCPKPWVEDEDAWFEFHSEIVRRL